MSYRITKKDLENVAEHLNHITGNPDKPYYRDNDGKYHANIGCYVLDWAYGGVALDRISTEGGGVTEIIGRGTKRETYYAIHAFIDGYLAREAA